MLKRLLSSQKIDKKHYAGPPHAPIFGRSAVAESLSHIPDRISDKEQIAGQLIGPCGKQ
jgi:hypothetical protein